MKQQLAVQEQDYDLALKHSQEAEAEITALRQKLANVNNYNSMLSNQHLKFVNVRTDKVKLELDTLRRENKLLRQECECLAYKLKELNFIYRENPDLRQMTADKSTTSGKKIPISQQTFGPKQPESDTDQNHFNRNEFLRFLETNQKSPRTPERSSRNLSPSKSCPEIRSGVEMPK